MGKINKYDLIKLLGVLKRYLFYCQFNIDLMIINLKICKLVNNGSGNNISFEFLINTYSVFAAIIFK